jgi:protocatechuate 3,4-dioxygenase beta subunit
LSPALVLAAVLSALAADPQTSRRARSPSPQPSAPPLLEGTVKGPDGKPVENALVVAEPAQPGMHAPALSARTDAKGAFRIVLKRPGLQNVQVEAKGLAPWKGKKVEPGAPLAVVLDKGLAIEGVVRDGGSGAPVPGARVSTGIGTGLPWEPESGTVATRTDAKGRYRLEGLPRGLLEISARAPGYARARRRNVRAGATADLSLFPGASLYGFVLDPYGRPVAGAVVRAEAEYTGAGQEGERTDATGRFELIGIAVGDYTLIARHPDFAPGVTTSVAIERGADTRVDVTLARGVPVTGRLLGADDAPVAGSLTVQELNGRAVGRSLAEVLRAETGADGRFRLEKLPPGSHALGAVAAGYARTRVDFDVGARAAVVDVGDVLLETGLSIPGRVSDASGGPIPDAEITAFGPRGSGMVEARSGPDGRFLLAGLVQATYWVRVGASGFGQIQRSVAVGEEGVEFVLQAAGAITGRVVDEGGRPIDSYRVHAQPLVDDARPRTTAVGSEDGRFSLDDVPAGTYIVQVTAPDREQATRSDIVVPAGRSVDVGTIRLAPGGMVRGTVADLQGMPVAGVTISVRLAADDYFDGSLAESLSDSTGAFEVRGVPAGACIAVGRHPDYAPGHSAPLEVVPGRGAVEARIQLAQGGRIEGSARKRDGGPVGPALVQLMPMASGGMATNPYSLRPDGSFTIEHVPAGRLRILLLHGQKGRYTGNQSRDVEIREGETSLVEFVQRDILVSGRVRRAGEPAPGLRVTFGGRSMMHTYGSETSVPLGPQRMTAVTRDDGGYELLVDEPGQTRVLVESMDERLSLPSRSVEIPDADSFALDLDFSGITVSGQVADKQTGQPIAGASVHAQGMKGERSFVGGMAGPDGRFQFELDPGEYRVNAAAEGYAGNSKEIRVPASGDVVLALSRGAVLKGKVVDAAGRGVAGLDVTALAGDRQDGSGHGWTYTRSDGSFQFDPLLRRPHNVLAGTGLVGFGLSPGAVPGDTPVVVTLRPPGMVQLLVRGPDGAPVAGAYPNLVQLDGANVNNPAHSPTTDAQGIAALVMPSGRIQLEVWKDQAKGSVSVDVSEGGSVAVEVTLAPPE